MESYIEVLEGPYFDWSYVYDRARRARTSYANLCVKQCNEGDFDAAGYWARQSSIQEGLVRRLEVYDEAHKMDSREFRYLGMHNHYPNGTHELRVLGGL